MCLSLHSTDFLQILQKAKRKGFVTIKWTTFAMFGASGVGKTSLLNLLLKKKPVREHNSTPIIQAPEPRLVSESADDNDESDEGTSSSDESNDGAASRVTEVESTIIMSDSSCFWIYADTETVKVKFLQALKSHAQIRRSETEQQELNTDQKKYTTVEKSMDVQHSDEQSLLMSEMKETQEYVPPDPSSLEEELLQLISEVEESDKLYEVHWMYGVDSGGQAAFLDIAPALLRYNSLNMVILRLDEMLDDPANFFYSVDGRKVGDGEKRQISTMQLTKSFFRCKYQLSPPLLGGVENVKHHGKPHFIVIGTCLDIYEKLQNDNQIKETLTEKNDRLRTELKNYESARIDYTKGKEIIFPVNTMSRKKNERQLAKRLRQITCKSYITAEVPARWFFFQLELKSRANGRRVISLEECLQIGKSINMQQEEVKAALWYFHNLTIHLYFPDILPNVVFLDPQVLFDKLSKLIAVSYGGDDYDVATVRNLKEKGIFKEELLDIVKLDEGIFSSADFLQLMQGLLIISKIPSPNDTKYFIPCVLDTIDDQSQNVCDENVETLFLTWEDQLIPDGLFTSLVVFLLGLDSPTQFQLGNVIHRNKVVLKCRYFGGRLHLLDQVKWLAIRYFGPCHNCYTIRRLILEGMKSIVDRFSWNTSLALTQEVFRCKLPQCTIPSFHFCQLAECGPMLNCDESDTSSDADNTRHLSWFDAKGMYYTILPIICTVFAEHCALAIHQFNMHTLHHSDMSISLCKDVYTKYVHNC